MAAVHRPFSRRRLLARGSLGILAIGLVGSLLEACAGAPRSVATTQASPSGAGWDSVLAAGRAEGQVLLYGNVFTSNQASKISEKFKAATGITLDVIALLGGPATTRIKEEVKVGKGPDVFEATGGWLETFDQSNQPVQSSFVALKEKPLPIWSEPESVWFVHPGYKSPNDWQWVLSRLRPRTGHLAVNTHLLPSADYPHSYHELATDPRYRGKIAYLDPSATSGGASEMMAFVYVAKAATPADFWGIIAGQDTLLLKESGANEVAVAQGQRAIGMPVADAAILDLIQAGAPVKHLYFPGVPHVAQSGEMGVLSSAPHPNAALVFVNWFLSKEGQEAVGPILQAASIRTDVASQAPKALDGEVVGGVGESKLFTERPLQTQFWGDLQQSGVLKGLVDGTDQDTFVANYDKFVKEWEARYGGPQSEILYLS